MKLLIEKGVDLNSEDANGLTALDYANDQDSGVMRDALREFKAKSGSGAGRKLRRANTSVVATADWPAEEVDYESDSVKYLILSEEKEK